MYEPSASGLLNRRLFAAQRADPYLQSHPMAAERIAALAEVARANPYWDKKESAGAAAAP